MQRSEGQSSRAGGAAHFDARALCSRKLWQIASGAHAGEVSERELSEVLAELARRRHYLEELAEIGKLERRKTN